MSRAVPAALLVRLPNWLGDLVLAWPVIDAAGRGGAVFLGPEAFRDLVSSRHPGATYLAVSRARRWSPVGAIRRARPSAALLLTESLSSALLAWLGGVPERIGYAAEGRGLLLTRRVARAGPARSIPRAREYAVLAAAAGLEVASEVPSLAALARDREAAGWLLDGAGVSGRPYAVIAPGAGYGPAKQWGPERFADAAGVLAAERGFAPVLVGSREDRRAAQAVVDALSGGAQAHDLTGSTDLPALVGVLAGAEVVLSNDSGVMHLAAALGRPTVGIFGSTSPVWTSDSSPWVRNLYAAYPCSPCFRRTCPIGYGCLRSITPDDAIRAAKAVLNSGETC